MAAAAREQQGPNAVEALELPEMSDANDNLESSDTSDTVASQGTAGAVTKKLTISQEHGISTLQATSAMVTAICGAGIMALPTLPAQGGIYATLLFVIVAGLVVMESSAAYVKAHLAWNRTHEPADRLTSFEDFGKAALGRCGGSMVRVSQIVWFVGVCSGLLVLMAQQLQTITGLGWGTQAWIAVLGPPLWLLCMLRNVTALAKLVPIGVVAVVASGVLIITAAWGNVQNWEEWPQEDVAKLHTFMPEHGLMPLGSVMATLFGAYAVMGNIPAIVNEMKNPARFPVALKSTFLIIGPLYAGVALIGYWGFGNTVQGNILLSMSKAPSSLAEALEVAPEQWSVRGHPLLAQILAYGVLANLGLTYPLCMMSVFASVQSLSCAKAGLQAGTLKNRVMRTGFVAATLLIAVALPDFGVIFSLFASVCGPVCNAFVPIGFGAVITSRLGVKTSPVRRFLHALIMVVALFCLVVGFVDGAGKAVDTLLG